MKFKIKCAYDYICRIFITTDNKIDFMVSDYDDSLSINSLITVRKLINIIHSEQAKWFETKTKLKIEIIE